MWLPRPIPVQEVGPLTTHPAPVVEPAPDMVPGTRIRELSDQELFAFFPDRPLAVVEKGGHQELVFLDEGETRGL